jgi:hypothetical protein
MWETALAFTIWGVGTWAVLGGQGAISVVAFTLTPFYLWYRGIARRGVARTSICSFAEPRMAVSARSGD